MTLDLQYFAYSGKILSFPEDAAQMPRRQAMKNGGIVFAVFRVFSFLSLSLSLSLSYWMFLCAVSHAAAGLHCGASACFSTVLFSLPGHTDPSQSGSWMFEVCCTSKPKFLPGGFLFGWYISVPYQKAVPEPKLKYLGVSR